MEKVKERNIAMWVAFSGYCIDVALTLATVYTSDIRTFVSMSSNILTAHLEHLYCQNIFSVSLCRFHLQSALMKAMVILLPILGLTWVIGLLAVGPYTTVFAWIFLFLNGFQVCPATQSS